MNRCVLDASVIIAAVLNEPGGERAHGHIHTPLVSAVNYAEVLSRLFDKGYRKEAVQEALTLTPMEVVGFDRAHAEASAELRSVTRSHGLSLGDRACLALALSRDAVALTTDRAWHGIDLPVQVELVR